MGPERSSRIVVGGEGAPEFGVLCRRAIGGGEAVAPPSAGAFGRGRGGGAAAAPPAIEQIFVGADHAGPDHAGLDVRIGHHRAQGDPAAHRVPPHADALRIGVGIGFHGGDSVEHIDGVAGRAVSACWRSFRIAVPAVIGAEDDVAVAGEAVDIGHVALGGAVLVGRDVAVVEDDHRPAAGRALAPRHGQQGVDSCCPRSGRKRCSGRNCCRGPGFARSRSPAGGILAGAGRGWRGNGRGWPWPWG